eukprot:TRINITY_DN625_c0_g1_i1.p2 TRINITY_DN625_c0_g1~~TRINITY_DN625_c0_g1_i1.p2  ORF type:complete len:67 (+),score=10.44 TRINITY_DN625_c0_g1_i1:143-343(+)
MSLDIEAMCVLFELFRCSGCDGQQNVARAISQSFALLEALPGVIILGLALQISFLNLFAKFLKLTM